MERIKEINTYNNIDTFEYDLQEMKYQECLTKELEQKVPQQINQDIINEIVLWKVNRYVRLNADTIALLNTVNAGAEEIEEELVYAVLKKLLNTDGVRLPMASAILRFRNPRVFQIIDQRAYRVVYGEELPAAYTSKGYRKPVEERIAFYLNYLKKIREVSVEKGWKFEDMDRILYMLDKKINNQKKIKT